MGGIESKFPFDTPTTLDIPDTFVYLTLALGLALLGLTELLGLGFMLGLAEAEAVGVGSKLGLGSALAAGVGMGV